MLKTQLPEIEYFRFEQDFMEDNIRCIPMIVRFKLDASGIKLKLKEWSKMTIHERERLAILPIDSPEDIEVYKIHVCSMVRNHTGESATELPVDNMQSGWMQVDVVPLVIEKKLREDNVHMSLAQWRTLSVLQRYALVKLTRPGHENKNFPKALKEFGII
jgi:hypothetical protein